MNIGIDYHLVSRNPNSGMGVYVSEIVKHMRRSDSTNQYIILNGSFLYKSKRRGFLENLFGLIKEQFWVQFTIPQVVDKEEINLFYFPNPPVPLVFFKPIVLTIPDLSFMYEKSINFVVKVYLFVIYFLSAHKAKVITTFSENSKKDITKKFKIRPNKIIVITPAASEKFAKITYDRRILKRYGIVRPYIFSMTGTFNTRKNPLDLVRVFKTLPKKMHDNLQVVLIGNINDGYFEDFRRLVEKRGLAEKIVCPGYVSEKDLVALYSGAKVLVSTSLYEGFGLPPLQAMACGTPVIAYNNSSLPEVVGEAGLLVNSRKQLRKAVIDIISKETLRNKLIKSGLSRAKLFSWKESAQKMLNIFDGVAG